MDHKRRGVIGALVAATAATGVVVVAAAATTKSPPPGTVTPFGAVPGDVAGKCAKGHPGRKGGGCRRCFDAWLAATFPVR